jgi:hypothetical protein
MHLRDTQLFGAANPDDTFELLHSMSLALWLPLAIPNAVLLQLMCTAPAISSVISFSFSLCLALYF